MKTTRTALLLLVVMALAAMRPVRAADLTVRFTGSFEQGTCAFSVPDTHLGTYLATYFDANPQSPWVTLAVTAQACTADIRMIHMALRGTAHAVDARLWAIATMPGLGIEIQSATNVTAIPNTTVLDWSPSSSMFALRARLSKTGTLTTYGRVAVPVTLQFTYN